MTAGFNPMRWRCESDGCFNEKRRPKIEAFADCFPRRINFGDIDGMVELSGCFCLLEWKGEGGSIKQGQQRSYVEFTKWGGNIVFVVNGNAETMAVRDYAIFWNGKKHPPVTASLDDLKTRIRKWVDWVQTAQEAA